MLVKRECVGVMTEGQNFFPLSFFSSLVRPWENNAEIIEYGVFSNRTIFEFLLIDISTKIPMNLSPKILTFKKTDRIVQSQKKVFHSHTNSSKLIAIHIMKCRTGIDIIIFQIFQQDIWEETLIQRIFK